MKDKETSIGFKGGKKPTFDRESMEQMYEEYLHKQFKEALEKQNEEVTEFIFRQFCHELSQIPPFKACLNAKVAGYADEFTKENFDIAIERAIRMARAALDYCYGSGRAKIQKD